MNNMDIISVIATVATAPSDEICISELLVNIGIDSLKMVEVIVSLENSFNVRFEDSALDPRKISTVEDIINLVNRNLLLSTVSG